MMLNGKRELIIPADEGYGAKGFPAWGIPPGGTLNFTSRILRPFSPNTFCVLVAIMIISVRVGVTLTSTPEYPSSASSRVKNSLSSALKTPSATNFRFFETCAAMVYNEKKEKRAFQYNVVTSFN